MKFLIPFYTAFIIISSLIVLLSGSSEMFGYLIWFQLLNIVGGSIGWMLINKLIKASSFFQIILRFFAGLLVLNILVLLVSNKIPSLILMGLGKKYDHFWISFFLHLIFLASFLIASKTDLKKLNKNKT